jgi:hypothetical protein
LLGKRFCNIELCLQPIALRIAQSRAWSSAAKVPGLPPVSPPMPVLLPITSSPAMCGTPTQPTPLRFVPTAQLAGGCANWVNLYLIERLRRGRAIFTWVARFDLLRGCRAEE